MLGYTCAIPLPMATWNQVTSFQNLCSNFPPHSKASSRQFPPTGTERLLYAMPYRYQGAWKSQAKPHGGDKHIKAGGLLASQPHSRLESWGFLTAPRF